MRRTVGPDEGDQPGTCDGGRIRPVNEHASSSTDEWPIPREGIAVTHLLIVRDVARSRHFYVDILGARALMEGSPTILRFYNSWLVLAEEGGPTDDKPEVVAAAPDGRTLTSALNLRVADVFALYERWRALGATFLTPPKDHVAEIRCYLRDPDGHLIEVGQTVQRPRTSDVERRNMASLQSDPRQAPLVTVRPASHEMAPGARNDQRSTLGVRRFAHVRHAAVNAAERSDG